MNLAIGGGLDEFYSARWWWRIRRAVAEARLASALDRFGEQSMEVRRATEDYRRMSFAVTYWRPAPGPVMRVVSNARKAGVPMSDLRLVVLNLDLRVSGEAVVVRPQRLVRFLSGAAFAVVLSHWTLLCALAVTSGAPPWLKLVLVAVISLIYVVLYRGWSIYTSRPLKTIERCGARLTEICLAANGGELRQLPQRPVDWKPK